MSSHLYNKGELPREDTFDHLGSGDYARDTLQAQVATSRRDLQTVRQQLADTRARGSSGEGHIGENAGSLNARDWHQKLEYLESKIRFIEREQQLAERALNRLR
ncbi:MAG: hypothetical protein IPK22_07010 [Verrucomicrobiaceae bacterium]|nr:hypothetical protein [Verrucomicrobiaceae bacterium]